MSLPTRFTDAASMRRHLDDLFTEQAAAGLAGLLDHGDYRSDLEHEIAFMRDAYVGAAVTEIAVLRAELGGRQIG
jgi:hypothetical protein